MKLGWFLNKCAGDINVILFTGEPVDMYKGCEACLASEALKTFKNSDIDIKDIRILKNNIMIKL